MTRYRFLALALLTVAFAWAGAVALAEDRDTKAGEKTFTGRIVRVDAEKGTLILGTFSGVKPDKERPAGDRAGKMMTFRFNKDTGVSLDGKEAMVKDLKVNLYARVTTRAPDRARPGGADTTAADRALVAERIEVFTKPPPNAFPPKTRPRPGTEK